MIRKVLEGAAIFTIFQLDDEIIALVFLIALVAMLVMDFIEFYLKEREAQREYPY